MTTESLATTSMYLNLRMSLFGLRGLVNERDFMFVTFNAFFLFVSFLLGKTKPILRE